MCYNVSWYRRAKEREKRMSVQLRSLYNDPENRQIIKVIDTSAGQVSIFEPTRDDVEFILAHDDLVEIFDQDWNNGEHDGKLDGATFLLDLLPRLTDLDLGDITPEEMDKILENPTVDLLAINAVVQGIVNKVYAFMVIGYKNNIQLQRLVNDTEEISDLTLGHYIEEISKTADGREQIKEIMEQSKHLEELKQEVDKSESEQDTGNEEQEAKPKSEEQVQFDDGKQADILNPDSYQKSVYENKVASRFADLEASEKDE